MATVSHRSGKVAYSIAESYTSAPVPERYWKAFLEVQQGWVSKSFKTVAVTQLSAYAHQSELLLQPKPTKHRNTG